MPMTTWQSTQDMPCCRILVMVRIHRVLRSEPPFYLFKRPIAKERIKRPFRFPAIPEVSEAILQAVGFIRVESCPTQAVLALVGLAADKVIRDP
ncbi:MAG: hypothetical protein R6U98_09505 [Pirellulaceae bacterium]